MKIIEIAARSNGAHRNQAGHFTIVPEGWAVIPEDMEIPDTFPFVNIEVEDNIVTNMTAGVKPEPVPRPEPEPADLTAAEMAEAIKEGVNAV